MSFRGLDPGQGLADYRNTLAEGWKQSQQLQQQDLTNRIAVQKAAEETGLGMDPNSPFHGMVENVPNYGAISGAAPSPISPAASVSPMTGGSTGQVPSTDLNSLIQSNMIDALKRYPAGVDPQTGMVHPFIYKAAETAALKKMASDAMAQRAAMDQPYKQANLANNINTNNRLAIGEQLKAEQAVLGTYTKLKNGFAGYNNPDLDSKIAEHTARIDALNQQLSQMPNQSPAKKSAAPAAQTSGERRQYSQKEDKTYIFDAQGKLTQVLDGHQP